MVERDLRRDRVDAARARPSLRSSTTQRGGARGAAASVPGSRSRAGSATTARSGAGSPGAPCGSHSPGSPPPTSAPRRRSRSGGRPAATESVPPTTTIFPRTTAGSNFPVSTCENERNGTVPGRAGEVDPRPFSGNADGSSVCPSARSAATTGNVSSCCDLVREPTDHAVGVRDVVAVGRPGAEHARVAAEDVRAPVGCDLRRREHDLRASLARVVDGRRRARHPRPRRAARRACRTPASASSAPCTECPRQ